MNDQNSQFENDNDRKQNESYSYVFSNGSMSTMQTPLPKKEKDRSRWLLPVFTVLMCLCLSFVGAFGGVIVARHVDALNDSSDKNNQDTETDNPQDLLAEDPEEVLHKAESNASIYGSAGEEVFSVSGVVRKVQDAVVVIDVTIVSSSAFGGSQMSTSSGSGVIISENGYILTCNHVVDGAKSVSVTLNSGSVYDASLVGSDETSDLAVLKIDADETLTYAEQGNSCDLVVGESVVAIGNPLGTLGGTVTTGIISATERNIQMSDGTEMTLIQTDTAINSGNSGGGLFNLDGQLIGIVNAKYSASGVEGLAFAIPIDSAYVVQQDLIQYGFVRGVVDHGLSVAEVTQTDLYYYRNYYYSYGITEPGIYIVSSEYSDEFHSMDRIISVNGVAVESADHMEDLISEYSVGNIISIEVKRDGKTVSVSLTLQEYVPERLKDLIN